MDRSQVDPKRELFRKLLRNIPSETVIRAMEQVPRELFVPQDSRHMAYLDLPLSIGEGQTISQPYVVAMMTEAMDSPAATECWRLEPAAAIKQRFFRR